MPVSPDFSANHWLGAPGVDFKRARALLAEMFEAAVAAADPANCVPPFLPPPPRGRTVVVGAGKAAAAMALAVEKHWPRSSPLSGIVVTRYGHGVGPLERIEVVEAAHPVPDGTGELAAKRILEFVKGLTANDLVICLISGGGSALLSLPTEGITLSEKQYLTRALLKSGTAIGDINTVRKHLSAVKGGRLAAAAAPARVLTLAISDVPGDDISTIASGPTVPDPSTATEALDILRRVGVDIPPSVMRHLKEIKADTPKPGSSLFRDTKATVIATAQVSLTAAAKVAEVAGVFPLILGDAIEGEAVHVAQVMAGIARQVVAYDQPASAPCVLISGGETTVTVRGAGRGGRNVEFLLALAMHLRESPRVFALAADTDGIDGTDVAAGAIIDPQTLRRASALGIDVPSRLADNDAHSVFDILGDRIVTGPTRTNVNDFRAILIARR